MRCAVWIIRQAISPRLAMRILLNMLVALRNPVGAAFIQEGVKPLLTFFTYANISNAVRSAVYHSAIDGLLADRKHQVLCGFHSFRAILGKLLQHLVTAGVHGVNVVADNMHKAESLGFPGTEYFR